MRTQGLIVGWLVCFGVTVGLVLPAEGAEYADPTLVDLLRQYDKDTRSSRVNITSPSGGPTGVATGSWAMASVGNYARWDLTFDLGGVYSASRLVLDYSTFLPDSFEVWYSTTDLAGLQQLDLTQVPPVWNGGQVQIALPGGDDGLALRYLEIRQNPNVKVDPTPNPDPQHIRLGNISLFASANSVFDDRTSGFSYMYNVANRPTYDSADMGTAWLTLGASSDNPAKLFNGTVSASDYVRSAGESDLSWFVVPFEEAVLIWGINLGGFETNGWSNCHIDISTAANAMSFADPNAWLADVEGSVWENVYSQSTRLPITQFIRLDGEDGEGVEAKWVRFSFSGSGSMSEIEFYVSSVPEPATMTLLALGGLAMLRRRRV